MTVRQMWALAEQLFAERDGRILRLHKTALLQHRYHVVHEFPPPAERCYRHDIEASDTGCSPTLNLVGDLIWRAGKARLRGPSFCRYPGHNQREALSSLDSEEECKSYPVLE